MSELQVSMERDHVEVGFLRETAPLQQILRNLNVCVPFVCKRDGVLTAECLLQVKDSVAEVMNYAATNDEDCREMLSHVVEYCRTQGKTLVEIGCGNASLGMYALFQRMGFRVTEVWPDHLLDDSKIASVENSIINRDMIRFRLDLQDKLLSTTGYDASGRT